MCLPSISTTKIALKNKQSKCKTMCLYLAITKQNKDNILQKSKTIQLKNKKGDKKQDKQSAYPAPFHPIHFLFFP